MGSKFYAVKSGRRVGIFNSWEVCQKQIAGYSGAVYKSFKTKEDAQQFINSTEAVVSTKKEESDGYKESCKIVAYIDGSYSNDLKRYSAGVVLFDGEIRYELMDSGNDKSLLDMRNVAGELMGAIIAMDWIESKYNEAVELVLYYDYEGIERWANSEWKANKSGTKSYQIRVRAFRENHQLSFVKVKAHTGNRFNELADQLAKRAMKISSLEAVEFGSSPIVNEYLDLLIEITSKNKSLKKKNELVFTFDDLTFRENDINRLIKALWKKDGNLVKNIISIEINIDVQNKMIKWEIINKENLNYKKNIQF